MNAQCLNPWIFLKVGRVAEERRDVIVRAQHPRAIWVAVPVSSPEAAKRIRSQVDRFICLHEPEPFYGVGRFYRTFDSVDDETVIRILV